MKQIDEIEIEIERDEIRERKINRNSPSRK